MVTRIEVRSDQLKAVDIHVNDEGWNRVVLVDVDRPPTEVISRDRIVVVPTAEHE